MPYWASKPSRTWKREEKKKKQTLYTGTVGTDQGNTINQGSFPVIKISQAIRRMKLLPAPGRWTKGPRSQLRQGQKEKRNRGEVPAASGRRGSILFLIQQINPITPLLMGTFVGLAYVASTS